MSAPARLILGYHGCDVALAQKIVCGQANLRKSSNEYDWLGDGVYFWEDSAQRALEWAQECVRQDRYKRAGVVGAVIDTGHCLNLIDAEYLSLVREAYAQFAQAMADAGLSLPKNTGRDLRSRKLDCAVFRFLHASRQEQGLAPFDTVRAFFTEGQPLYENSGIRERDHIQICVRDPDRIIGYFLPRTR